MIIIGLIDSDGKWLSEKIRQYFFMHLNAEYGISNPKRSMFLDVFSSDNEETDNHDDTIIYNNVELLKDFKIFKKGEKFTYIMFNPHSLNIHFVRDEQIVHFDIVNLNIS